MDMIKWFNKQKPITLGFITAIAIFIISYVMSYFTEVNFEQLSVIKFCYAVSLLTFIISYSLFTMTENSLKIFNEIDLLFISAKKAKTKEELETVESDYKILRKRCQHQNHHAKMNEVFQIIQTKKEFYKV